MSFDPKGCSHGVGWDEDCPDCNAITLKQELYDLSVDVKHVASELEKMPGMASDPRVVIDLYRTINRLTMLLLREGKS